MEAKSKHAIGLAIFLSFLLAGALIGIGIGSSTGFSSTESEESNDLDERAGSGAKQTVYLMVKTDQKPELIRWTLKDLVANTRVDARAKGFYKGQNKMFSHQYSLQVGRRYQWIFDAGYAPPPITRFAVYHVGNRVSAGDWVFKDQIKSGISTYTLKVGEDPALSNKQQWYLNAHNALRRTEHLNYGVSYRPLVWNVALAASAQRWAKYMHDNGCKVYHPDNKNDAHTPYLLGNDMGEIADKVSWDGFDHPARAREKVMKRFRESPAHFRNQVWRGTRFMGLGIAESYNCKVVVVRFQRPGNCPAVTWDNWQKLTYAGYSSCGAACPSVGCY